VSWRDLEAGAPDLAREGWARFERTKVALLGTIREDGSPRISPVQPYLIEAELVVGVMPSPKVEDLRRDPRCVLHSSVSDLDGSEGEFKVHGRADPTDDERLLDAEGTWWAGRSPDRVGVFTIEIDEAILITWTADQGRMTTARWSRDEGARTQTRTYP
jgi:Pyridoxamine 5'-phosphate oxidase